MSKVNICLGILIRRHKVISHNKITVMQHNYDKIQMMPRQTKTNGLVYFFKFVLKLIQANTSYTTKQPDVDKILTYFKHHQCCQIGSWFGYFYSSLDQ